MKNLEITKTWNNLDRDDKLEIIEQGIDFMNTNEGSLFLRLYRKDNSIGASIQTQPDNHLSVEAVSKTTLITLFSENYDFNEEDAKVILNWMENQK